MKKVIIYSSESGFSEQYAKWLGEDLSLDVLEYKATKKMDLDTYDEIIIVNGVQGGRIPLFQWIIPRYNNKLVILAVGYSENPENKYRDILKNDNNIADDLFYVRGGLCYEKLGFFTRGLLKKVTKVKESVSYIAKENLEEIEKFLKEEEN